MREGLEPMEPLEKTPALIAKMVSVLKAEDLEEFLGKPEYSILIHEKVVALVFRAGKKFVLVTAGRKFPLDRVARLLNVVSRMLAPAQIHLSGCRWDWLRFGRGNRCG